MVLHSVVFDFDPMNLVVLSGHRCESESLRPAGRDRR